MCLINSTVNCALILKRNIPTVREGRLHRRHFWMKKKRSAVSPRRGEACGLWGAPWQKHHHLSRAVETRISQTSVGTTRSCGCVVFFLPPLWLTIFYIIMTQLGLGTDSPAKVLCGRKMCMKWKTTSLRRGFSSSRRFAAIAQTLYGKHPLCTPV